MGKLAKQARRRTQGGERGEVSDFTIPSDAVWETARQLAECQRELAEARAALDHLRANRDYWLTSCQQAQEHRDEANAQADEFEAEVVRLRAERDEARAALREFVAVWDYGDCDWLDADGFIDWSGYRDAADRHAAALTAARERT